MARAGGSMLEKVILSLIRDARSNGCRSLFVLILFLTIITFIDSEQVNDHMLSCEHGPHVPSQPVWRCTIDVARLKGLSYIDCHIHMSHSMW